MRPELRGLASIEGEGALTLRRTVGRNTVFNVLGKIAFVAAWIFLTPSVLSRLGREQFGFWSILLLIGGSLSFFDLGLTAAITRYTAQLEASGRRGAIRSMVGRAVLAYLGLAGSLAVVGLLVTPLVLRAFHVPEAWRSEAATAYALSFLCFGLLTVATVVQGAVIGLQRMDLSSGIGLALTPVLILLVKLALGFPHPLTALIVALLAHGLLTQGLLWLALWRLLPRTEGPEATGGPPMREMMAFGLRIQTSVVASFFHNQADKVLLGTLVGLTWVAPVELGLRVTNGLVSLPQLFLGALMPALAGRDAERGGEGRGDLYLRVQEPYLFLLVVPVCTLIPLLADPLLQAWIGTAQPDAAFAIRVQMLSGGAILLCGVPMTFVRVGGRPGLEARFGLLALGLHVPLSLAGVWLLGWKGALLGGLVASLVASVWFLGTTEAWLGLPRFRLLGRSLLRVALPTALAGLGTWLVLRAWPVQPGRPHALLRLFGAGASFSLIYVLALGRILPEEARRLFGEIKRTLPSWPNSDRTRSTS